MNKEALHSAINDIYEAIDYLVIVCPQDHDGVDKAEVQAKDALKILEEYTGYGKPT